MGAVFSVPFSTTDRWLETVTAIAADGAQAVALTPRASATSLSDYVTNRSSDQRVVLMLGAEGPGLSADAINAATVNVRIPIVEQVDSLNVIFAAGIVLAAIHEFGDSRIG